MGRLVITLALLLSLALVSGTSVELPQSIQGTWIRVEDQLRIEIKEHDANSLHSFIVAEGSEKFPCEVSELAIYKDIVRAGENRWNCQFLVVTIRSCATEYQTGAIRLTRSGHLEVNCPGFAKKIYARSKPRYSESNAGN